LYNSTGLWVGVGNHKNKSDRNWKCNCNYADIVLYQRQPQRRLQEFLPVFFKCTSVAAEVKVQLRAVTTNGLYFDYNAYFLNE
jgi:hypothetical protein